MAITNPYACIMVSDLRVKYISITCLSKVSMNVYINLLRVNYITKHAACMNV